MRARALFGLALLALAASAAWWAWTLPPKTRFERVILISLDTVRADHLGCYGREGARTPHLDALAARGVRFEQAMTAATTTLASHTSLFTGTYPHTHGVARNGFTVSPENVTLAERLREAGFATAAFLGSFALDRRFGVNQGFDVWDQRFDVAVDGTHEQEQRKAGAVTDAALAWVEREQPSRFLLFAHYFDAHQPYEPPPPFDTAFTRSGAPRKATLADVDAVIRAQQARTTGTARGAARTIVGGLDAALLDSADGQALPADEDLAALYAGEIAYVDQEVGRLLDGLEQRGLLEDALVVVFADHGETFAEHADYWNHGLWTYETTAHVPLIVAARGNGAQGLAPCSVPEPVSTVDVFPTVCDLLGLEMGRVDGVSQAPWMRGEWHRRGPIFCEATQPASVERPRTPTTPWENALKAQCVRSGAWKLVLAPYLGREELYDLGRDPGERVNLLQGGLRAHQHAELRSELDAFTRSARPLPSRFDPTQARETAEKLKRLGYPGDDEDAPAPR